MRTRTPVYSEQTQVQQSDTDDLTMVNLSSPPAGTLLVPEGTMSTALAPGQVGFIGRVFMVRKLLRITGKIALPLPEKPLNALFFRNDSGAGTFNRVVSLQTQLQGDGSFKVEINKESYANLIPGFFVVGLRNPKANRIIVILELTVTSE